MFIYLNSRCRKILNTILDPRIVVASYLVFFLLAQVQFLKYHLGYTQYILFLWSVIVIFNQYTIIKTFRKTPNLFIYGSLLIAAGLTLIYNFGVDTETQIKSALLLSVSILLFYPLGIAIAKRRTYEKDLTLVVLPSLAITFCQALASFICVLTLFSYVGIHDGKMVRLGLQEFIYTSSNKTLLLFGFNGNSNHAAVFSMVSIILSTWIFINKNKIWQSPKLKKFFTVLYWFNLFLQIISLILSNSRASYLVGFCALFCIGIAWAIALKKQKQYSLKKTLVLFSIGFMATSILTIGTTKLVEDSTHLYIVNHNKTVSSHSQKIDTKNLDYSKDDYAESPRPIIWREALKLYTHSPILGLGPYNTGYYAQKYNIGDSKTGFLRHNKAIHNSYLDVLLSYGLLGFSIYVIFIIRLCNTWRKRAFTNGGFDYEDIILGFCWLNLMGTVFFLTDAFLGADYDFAIILLLSAVLAYKQTNKGLPKIDMQWEPKLNQS